MSKRICVVINHMEQGGVSSSVKNFCVHANKLGYQVDFLNMSSDSNMSDDGINSINKLRLSGYRKYWNLSSTNFKKLNNLRKLLLAPLVLLKKITNRYGKWLELVFRKFSLPIEYDCVFAYNQCAPCYYFAIHCVKAKRKVAVIHGNINFMGDISSWNHMLYYFDYIACVSNAVKSGFVNSFPALSQKFCTMYNMFDIDNIRKKALEISSVQFDKSIVNIISISRHDNAHKAVHRIPEICYELKNSSISNFHWYIVGDGPDFEENLRYADKLNVTSYLTFCGPLDNPFPLLVQSDFLVLTSYTEAYSMALKEAHVLNIPTIAAYYPGIDEAIQDKFNGLIAEQSVESLTEKIADMILNSDNIRTSLSDNLHLDQFSNDSAYTQMKNIIEID